MLPRKSKYALKLFDLEVLSALLSCFPSIFSVNYIRQFWCPTNYVKMAMKNDQSPLFRSFFFTLITKTFLIIGHDFGRRFYHYFHEKFTRCLIENTSVSTYKICTFLKIRAKNSSKNSETPFCPSCWGVLYPSKSKIRMKNLPRGQRIRSSCFHDHDNSWWLKSLVDKNDNKLSRDPDFHLNPILLYSSM